MITVEPLSAEAFAPFGRVVGMPDREPDATGEPWRWWADTAALAPADGSYTVGYLEIDRGVAAFDWAERHIESEELVVPVRGRLLVYVGPAGQGDDPARDRFRVFEVRPGEAVVLANGVWHGAPLAGDGSATAIVLLLEGTGANDTQVVRFDEIPVEV